MKILIQSCLVCTWDEFCEDNRDGFTPAELATIKAQLETGKEVTVGGGSADEFTLRALEIFPSQGDDRRKGEEPRSPAMLPEDAIYFVAFFNGFWAEVGEELWTLRVTLAPNLLAGSSYARSSIEAFLHPQTVAA